MILEGLVVAALVLGAYNFVTNSLFRAKVEADVNAANVALVTKFPELGKIENGIATLVKTAEKGIEKYL